MREMFVVYWLELGEYVTPQMLIFSAVSALVLLVISFVVKGCCK